MDSQSGGGGGLSPGSSQSSVGSSASSATTTIPSTPSTTTGCQQTHLKDEFEELAAYLAREKAPKRVRNALKRIHDAYEERAQKQTTTDAIQSLQEAIRKLKAQIEAKPTGIDATKPQGTSYAAAAQRGAAVAAQGNAEPTKPVPARHKREIIVSKGEETPEQARRAGKEIIEQLNSMEMEGEVVAVRHLPSGDIVLTTDDEQTRTKWITDRKWLAAFGTGARVKRREFVVLAHGIRVGQV
jgi:polyhydroxyalkanoate synthesis regulator phasin